jgi:hypothetical protein
VVGRGHWPTPEWAGIGQHRLDMNVDIESAEAQGRFMTRITIPDSVKAQKMIVLLHRLLLFQVPGTHLFPEDAYPQLLDLSFVP